MYELEARSSSLIVQAISCLDVSNIASRLSKVNLLPAIVISAKLVRAVFFFEQLMIIVNNNRRNEQQRIQSGFVKVAVKDKKYLATGTGREACASCKNNPCL